MLARARGGRFSSNSGAVPANGEHGPAFYNDEDEAEATVAVLRTADEGILGPEKCRRGKER
jgi:hypothetical protein